MRREGLLGERVRKTVFWQRDASGASLVRGGETTFWRRLADGSTVQSTDQCSVRPFTGEAFQCELNRWKRFADAHGLADIRLGYTRQVIRFYNASGHYRRLAPEWRVALSFPCPHFGVQMVARTYRGHRLPTRVLQAELTARMGLKGLTLTDVQPERLWFGGDVLLRSLAPALEHVFALSESMGRWVVTGGVHEPVKGSGGKSGYEKGLVFQPLPESLYFVPNQERVIGEGKGGLRVLFYDQAGNTLVCWNGRSYQPQYVGWRPSEPLYRYFKRLSFLSTAKTTVLRDIQYEMPDAVLPSG